MEASKYVLEYFKGKGWCYFMGEGESSFIVCWNRRNRDFWLFIKIPFYKKLVLE